MMAARSEWEEALRRQQAEPLHRYYYSANYSCCSVGSVAMSRVKAHASPVKPTTRSWVPTTAAPWAPRS